MCLINNDELKARKYFELLKRIDKISSFDEFVNKVPQNLSNLFIFSEAIETKLTHELNLSFIQQKKIINSIDLNIQIRPVSSNTDFILSLFDIINITIYFDKFNFDVSILLILLSYLCLYFGIKICMITIRARLSIVSILLIINIIILILYFSWIYIFYYIGYMIFYSIE